MAGLGVHCRYDPALRDTARYAPPSRHLGVGLDVLAGHHRQKRRRLRLLVAELRALERVEHPLGVADQLVDEPGPLVGVAPVTHRLGAAVVVTGQHQRGRPPAPGLRTRRICAPIIVTVSWVATASYSTVESNARRVLFDSAPHSAATSRTASKIRSGRSLARSL